MKKLLCTILLILTLPAGSWAQKDLCIGKILGDDYKKNPAATEVEIMGERLQKYGLTYYHSLTVKNDTDLMEKIITAFKTDERKACDKEMTNIGGRLYSGLYRLTYDGYVNRFVFFKDMRLSPQKKPNAVIVIYMEGETSLKALQKKFKK